MARHDIAMAFANAAKKEREPAVGVRCRDGFFHDGARKNNNAYYDRKVAANRRDGQYPRRFPASKSRPQHLGKRAE
jgi:hypothetical protein